ncbi:MAG: DUF2235 domain-containing protein [Marmoricola sp.]
MTGLSANPPKRLIVCCDGTWNKPDNVDVTNVEKIARTVQTDAGSSGGVQQLVYYISGVGTSSYEADRLLGGAFGLGLFHNVIACYRFLSQNYEPGDEIFIIGFSRGAYTARSLAGMVAKVGLLTKVALVEDRLAEAVHIYQGLKMPPGTPSQSPSDFKRDHCYAPKITFLGVFDTVGALGVPGFEWATPRFHDVQLSDQVLCARHALAVDETRLKFAPTLWEAAEPVATEDPRVKQVWFEGCHSDVGGGYPEGQTGLSDTALLWMVQEARKAGLVFDISLLSIYLGTGAADVLHNPLDLLFRIDNALLTLKGLLPGQGSDQFIHGRRRLTNDRALSIRVASSVVAHFEDGTYRPFNLAEFASETHDFDGIIEPVDDLPDPHLDLAELA